MVIAEEGVSCREHNGPCVTELKLKEIDFSISCKSNLCTSSLRGDSTGCSKAGFEQIIQACRRQYRINIGVGGHGGWAYVIKFCQASHFSLANASECIGRRCTRGHGVTAREFKRKIYQLWRSWNRWISKGHCPRFLAMSFCFFHIFFAGARQECMFFTSGKQTFPIPACLAISVASFCLTSTSPSMGML